MFKRILRAGIVIASTLSTNTFMITLAMMTASSPKALAGQYTLIEPGSGEVFIVDTDRGTVAYPRKPGENSPTYYAVDPNVTYEGSKKILTWKKTAMNDLGLVVTVETIGHKTVAHLTRNVLTEFGTQLIQSECAKIFVTY